MQKPGWWSSYELAASFVDSRCLLVAPTAGETTWVDGRPWAEPFQGWPERSGVGMVSMMSGVLGEDERPKGVGLLHHVGRTRSGSSTGDQKWHRQLTSCAVTPALQDKCISWTPWSLRSWGPGLCTQRVQFGALSAWIHLSSEGLVF